MIIGLCARAVSSTSNVVANVSKIPFLSSLGTNHFLSLSPSLIAHVPPLQSLAFSASTHRALLRRHFLRHLGDFHTSTDGSVSIRPRGPKTYI